MPELPDITIYVEALERRVIGERLEGVRIQSPLLLRTFDPPLESVDGKIGPRGSPIGQADRSRAR